MKPPKRSPRTWNNKHTEMLLVFYVQLVSECLASTGMLRFNEEASQHDVQHVS